VRQIHVACPMLPSTMMSSRKVGCVLAALTAITFASQTLKAQTVSQSGQLYPDRLVNGQSQGQSTRPQNLNPFGVNYNDCIQDMTLHFTVAVSAFTGSDNLEVWATKSGDCTSPQSRGIGAASAATCWMVSQGITGLVASSVTTKDIFVNVRDLVGPQKAPPFPTGLGATQAHGEQLGSKACENTQASFLAVPMSIWFMAVNSGGTVDGTPYQYGSTNNFITDLLGPPAPASVSIADGDTLFVVNWQANSDSDTAAYDVYMDPIRGQEGASAHAAVDASVLYCPEAGGVAPQTGNDGALADSGDASTPDAASTVPSGVDAACILVNVGGPPPVSAACNDGVLVGSIIQDAGAVSAPVYDQDGNVIDGGVATGSGGVSSIPPQYLVGATAPSVTVSDKATGTYTITRLQNNTTYTVVVAAVDGSGNVGPPSSQACDYPAPVNDFWNTYRNAGGRAGGGFCAVAVLGQPLPAAAVLGLLASTTALAFRRRRKRR
jgi:hypothetical protein